MRAATVTPQLELRAGSDLVKAPRPKGQPIYLDLGVYVAAMDAPFEVWVTRPDYTQPLQVDQVLYDENGVKEFKSLPVDVLDEWFGLKDFLKIEVRRGDEVVKTKTLSFCPNAYDRQRLNDSGADRPTYPDGCFGNPFTKGVVWGIDEGWAVNPASSFFGGGMRLADGLYDVTVSVDQRYLDMFEMSSEKASVDLQLKVRTVRGFHGCPDCPVHTRAHTAGRHPAVSRFRRWRIRIPRSCPT